MHVSVNENKSAISIPGVWANNTTIDIHAGMPKAVVLPSQRTAGSLGKIESPGGWHSFEKQSAACPHHHHPGVHNTIIPDLIEAFPSLRATSTLGTVTIVGCDGRYYNSYN